MCVLIDFKLIFQVFYYSSHLILRPSSHSLVLTSFPKSVFLPGEQVAVFRGTEGKAYVVDAYCPHLGANLAVGGRVVGQSIECPFHGWQFRGEDGKCVRIPYAEKGEKPRPTQCNLTMFIMYPAKIMWDFTSVKCNLL